MSNQYPAVMDTLQGIRCFANLFVRFLEVNIDDLGVNFRYFGNPFTSTLCGMVPG